MRWVRSLFRAVGAWDPAAAVIAALLTLYVGSAVLFGVPTSITDSLALQQRGLTTDAVVLSVSGGRVPQSRVQFETASGSVVTRTLEHAGWRDPPRPGDSLPVR